jgi:hypothetical protein
VLGGEKLVCAGAIAGDRGGAGEPLGKQMAL